MGNQHYVADDDDAQARAIGRFSALRTFRKSHEFVDVEKIPPRIADHLGNKHFASSCALMIHVSKEKAQRV